MSAHVCSVPALMLLKPAPVAATGKSAQSRPEHAPLMSEPSFPFAVAPQQYTTPLSLIAQLWLAPDVNDS
jgi:hypothetical protein